MTTLVREAARLTQLRPVPLDADHWSTHAACLGNWDAFDLATNTDTSTRRQYAAAVAICRTCPVQLPCLADALTETVQHGVRGGLTPNQRKALQ